MMGNLLFIVAIVAILVVGTALGCWYEEKCEREARESEREMMRSYMAMLRLMREAKADAIHQEKP